MLVRELRRRRARAAYAPRRCRPRRGAAAGGRRCRRRCPRAPPAPALPPPPIARAARMTPEPAGDGRASRGPAHARRHRARGRAQGRARGARADARRRSAGTGARPRSCSASATRPCSTRSRSAASASGNLLPFLGNLLLFGRRAGGFTAFAASSPPLDPLRHAPELVVPALLHRSAAQVTMPLSAPTPRSDRPPRALAARSPRASNGCAMTIRPALATLVALGLLMSAGPSLRAASPRPLQAAQQRPVQPVAPASAPAANPAVAASDYRLGAGDKLRIEVYKDPQLSQSLQIRPDGKITMPLDRRSRRRRPDADRAARPDRGRAQGVRHQPRGHGDRRRGAGLERVRDGRGDQARSRSRSRVR